MGKFFLTAEAAEICHVSRGSILRWIQEGKLKAALTMGGHHRISPENLIEALSKLQMPIPPELLSSKRENFKVLIVEDEVEMRNMLRGIFQRHFSAASIEEVEDGVTAGYKIHEMKPDLVILDIQLPGVNGVEICRLIRSFLALRHTRIIAITGRGEEVAQEIIKQGADSVFHKPFDTKLFIKDIQQKLNLSKK